MTSTKTQTQENEKSFGFAENTNNKDYSKEYDGCEMIFASEQTEAHKVKNTPFTVCRENEEIFLATGKFKLPERYKTIDEAIEDAKKPTWDKIMAMVDVCVTEMVEYIMLKKQTNE